MDRTSRTIGAGYNLAREATRPVWQPPLATLQKAAPAIVGTTGAGVLLGAATGRLRAGEFVVGQEKNPIERQVGRVHNTPNGMQAAYVWAGLDPDTARGPSAFFVGAKRAKFGFFPAALVPGQRGAPTMMNANEKGVFANVNNIGFGPNFSFGAHTQLDDNLRAGVLFIGISGRTTLPAGQIDTRSGTGRVSIDTGPASILFTREAAVGPVKFTSGQLLTLGSLSGGIGTNGITVRTAPVGGFPFMSAGFNSSYDPNAPSGQALRRLSEGLQPGGKPTQPKQ
jgi:hypothetical protein